MVKLNGSIDVYFSCENHKLCSPFRLRPSPQEFESDEPGPRIVGTSEQAGSRFSDVSCFIGKLLTRNDPETIDVPKKSWAKTCKCSLKPIQWFNGLADRKLKSGKLRLPFNCRCIDFFLDSAIPRHFFF